jgi:lysophospholipase L1-like esterase
MTSTSFVSRILIPIILLGLSTSLGFSTLSAQNIVAGRPVKIAIVGDSTVANYKETDVLRGWGQMLHEFFTPETQIDNFAENGRSTKTFFKTPHWQQTLDDKPDIILIQFGHNDSHTPAAQHPEATQADGDYMDNLRKYVADARRIGATPIFVTPMHRRTFQPDGTMTLELLPYVLAMKKVGLDMKVPVIDLYAKSGDLFTKLGDAASSDFTPKDRTHFSAKGARVMAFFVAQGAATADDRLKAAEITPLPDPTTALKAVPVGSSTPANPGSSNTPDATMKNEVPPAR